MRPFDVRGITPAQKQLFEYIIWWIRHPDEGSAFERKTRILRWLPDRVVLWILVWFEYGGLIFMASDEDTIIGHIFHQRREDAIHVFSISTRREYRERRVATDMTRQLLLLLECDVSIRKVRIGAGKHPAVERIVRRIVEGRLGLPFPMIAGNELGWVYIER